MQINNSELKNLIFGAIRAYEEEGWLKLSRFSEKQIQNFIETSATYSLRAKASSGIMMDFTTDAINFSFDYKHVTGSSQKICYIDVYVDDNLIVHHGADNIDEHEGNLLVDMKKGTKRVTVVFPNLFGTAIKNVCINDGAWVKPVEKTRKLLFLGDSITQGYTAAFPSLSYANIITKKLNAQCVNQGIGGDVFNEKNLDENLGYDADTVFVAYGTNDWSHGKDIKANATAYFKKLTSIYPDAQIYTLLPIFRGNKGSEPAMEFNEMRKLIADICKNYKNVKVLDTIDYVPHFENFFMPDFLHPNDLGFMMYAKGIFNNIK